MELYLACHLVDKILLNVRQMLCLVGVIKNRG